MTVPPSDFLTILNPNIVQVSTIDPVRKGGPITLYVYRPAAGDPQPVPLRETNSFDQLDGFKFEVLGELASQTSSDLNAQHLITFDFPGVEPFVLDVKLVAASWPGATVRAVMRWTGQGDYVQEGLEPLAETMALDDGPRGNLALDALHRFCTSAEIKARRPRLEELPNTPELELARRARDLRTEHPDWDNRRLINELGMLDLDDYGRDSITDTKIERAQIRKLQRWEARLREFEP